MTKTPLILETGRQVRVLALDTSTHCGWATDALETEGGPPRFGTWELGGYSPKAVGHAFGKLFDLIDTEIKALRITHVVIEAPLNVYAHSGFKGSKARKEPDLSAALLGFWAIAEGAAAVNRVQMFQVQPATVRKHFIANGRHPDPKAAVMARCRQLGWKPQNDNEGDALSIWDYAKSVLDPGWAGRAPFALFQQGRRS